MTTRIIGTGSCLPETIADNEFMAKIVDTNDEWISSRTGIRSRRLVKEETTTGMAAEAGRMAIADAGILAGDIDLIIAATITPDHYTPGTACEVQREIGAERAVAFDLNAACTGFLYALNTAHAYIQAGIYQNALIIGADTMSKLIDWTDKGTCVLFGDGAGAVVVQSDTTGVIRLLQKSDGSKGSVLTCYNRGNHNPFVESESKTEYMHMDGQDVFKFAVKKVPECINQLMEGSEYELGDIKYLVLHQANRRIILSVAKRLKLEEEKFPMNMENYGNTSAASIPILLDEMNRAGMLNRGDKLIISGFGAGLTWGATLLEW